MSMFVDAASNLRIFCDYGSQMIRVATNTFPPEFKPQYAEVARFTTATTWYTSPYAKQVSSEQLQEDITWFWLDVEHEQHTTEEN